MARKPMKKFAQGGDAAQTARYARKTADIESDYQKALKAGRSSGIAKAKYEQRMADAADDLAKWTRSDRTQTRAAESAAEKALSEARRTKGVSMLKSETPAVVKSMMDEPIETRRPSPLSASPTPKPTTARPAQNRSAPQRPATQRMAQKRWPDWAEPAATASATPKAPPPPPAARPNVNAPPAKKVSPQATSPWEKDAAGLFTNRYPNALQERGKDVFSLGLNSLGRGKPAASTGRSAYDATTAYYKNQDIAEAAAKQKEAAAAAKAAADREAKRQRDIASAVAAGIWPAGTPDKPFKFTYNKAKGGAIKKKPTRKYAKGGSIDGCAIRGKTRAKRT